MIEVKISLNELRRNSSRRQLSAEELKREKTRIERIILNYCRSHQVDAIEWSILFYRIKMPNPNLREILAFLQEEGRTQAFRKNASIGPKHIKSTPYL